MAENRCEHNNFHSDVSVDRIQPKENMPVSHYAISLKVKCIDCNIDFRFLGDRVGLSSDHPTIGVMGHELRAPMHPNDGTIPLPPKMKGFSVSTLV